MKKFFLFTLLLGLMVSCIEEETPNETLCTDFDESILNSDQIDFYQIVFGSEFSNSVDRVRKWDSEVRIFVPAGAQDSWKSELAQVVGEINSLSESVFLRITEDEESANLIFFFGSGEDYVRLYNSQAVNLIDTNRGLFSIQFQLTDFQIIGATCWVDGEAMLSDSCRQHLIREELTQALGMVNDIDTDDQSIFLQRFTCTPFYSKRDEDFIRFFLSEKIKPGLCKSQVFEFLKF
ncbi:hypothetical protein Aoki45_04130 [Algoriphagus sp. oki45]|uniref:DUF2927 domain-containing protein n=1 Tax=Algoriphagus sp. oki45 TaxID=3067294 RepID=UPI0027E659ED|nr:hypothetical protein Aoki45_04130 [Algoriphagus sp. oki45]